MGEPRYGFYGSSCEDRDAKNDDGDHNCPARRVARRYIAVAARRQGNSGEVHVVLERADCCIMAVPLHGCLHYSDCEDAAGN